MLSRVVGAQWLLLPFGWLSTVLAAAGAGDQVGGEAPIAASPCWLWWFVGSASGLTIIAIALKLRAAKAAGERVSSPLWDALAALVLVVDIGWLVAVIAWQTG